jgi:hypothetical protein
MKVRMLRRYMQEPRALRVVVLTCVRLKTTLD